MTWIRLMIIICYTTFGFIFCPLIPQIVLLQEKKLLDLPKLLDICAIYGHENEDLTKLLVRVFSSITCNPSAFIMLQI